MTDTHDRPKHEKEALAFWNASMPYIVGGLVLICILLMWEIVENIL